MVKVLIDSREKSRIKLAEDICKDKGIDFDVRQLTSNDYIFFNENKTVGFEFKEIRDFVGSISDGKIFRQIVESDTDYTFVIISDYRNLEKALFVHNTYSKKPMHSVVGAIARLNTLCDGVWIENTPIFTNCFNKMFVQASKCFNTKHYSSRMEFGVQFENTAINYLSSVKGVSSKTAMNICMNLNLNNLEDLLQLNKKDLLSFKGIGDKTADKIMEALK